MIKSEDIRFFLTIAEEASLAAAARRLNVTSSAVSQRLQSLENMIGLRLSHRNGRSMILTDEGRLLAEQGSQIVADLEKLVEGLRVHRGAVFGQLRVLAPLGFGRRYIAPLCAEFQEQYPDLKIDLILVDRLGRHPEQAWDVAVHVGELPASSLRVRKLASNRRILCASPAYLAGRPSLAHPADLRDHDCIVLRENDEDSALWKLHRGDDSFHLRISPKLASNDGNVVREWALAGKGIIVRSEWDVARDVHEGRLVPLLPEYGFPAADVVLLTGGSADIARRTRVFIDFLAQRFRGISWVEQG